MNGKRDVMVCVTGQRTCERLIREGAQIAGIKGVGVHVVHVAHEGERFMSSAEKEAEALEYLLRRSNDVGADMTVLHARDPKAALCDYAVRNGIGCVVLGVAPGPDALAFARALEAKLPGVEICPVMA